MQDVWRVAPDNRVRHPAAQGRGGWYEGLLREHISDETLYAALEIVQTYASQESQLLQEEFYRSLLSAYTVAEVRRQLRRAGLRGLEVSMATDRHLDVFGRVG